MKFDYRFTYRVTYVVRRGRRSRPAYLTGVQPVEIVEVDPAEAPLAYGITTSPYNGQHHEVRAFGGSLWWQMFDRSGNPLEVSAFIQQAGADWWKVSRVLDPLRRTYYVDQARTLKEFLEGRVLSKDEKKFDDSNREVQAKQAERDASNVIFCGGRVLFNGGDPVWYANRDDVSRRVDLEIGHSDLDRLYYDHKLGRGFMTTGPDRKERITCASTSFAFGLDEKDLALAVIDDLGYEVNCHSESTAFSDHVPSSSAALCVRASAQNLRDIACWHPEMRRDLPELKDASRTSPPSTLRADQELLRRFVSLSYRWQFGDHADRVDAARKALDRLEAFEPLSEIDEEALSMLGSLDLDDRPSTDPAA
ncbi:hypothetical protein AB4Z51_24455 [Bradyrhizobium sp. 2TAF36]|uniref:hypothetical protein n=1 Tax=Bradyrhizobium sp. 2TAF36 TaxID=3233016 RepID=UPI003F90D055